LQVKLLRVLEEREFQRVGGVKTIPFEARVISATNRDLETEIAAGSFRQDLHSRLAQMVIRLPALRERKSDIPKLAEYFLSKLHAERPEAHRIQFAPESLEIISEQPFKNGNVRELRALIGNLVAGCRGDFILPAQVIRLLEQRQPKAVSPLLAPAGKPDENTRRLLAELTRELGEDWPNRSWEELKTALQVALARVILPAKRRQASNIAQAASSLGMDKGTFYTWWKKANLKDELGE
jgi:two-component system response regulator AtoC